MFWNTLTYPLTSTSTSTLPSAPSVVAAFAFAATVMFGEFDVP
jgi:hypothetical protein